MNRRENTRSRRLLRIVAAFALALVTIFAATACQSDEQLVRTQVDQLMSELSEASDWDLETILGDQYQEISDKYAQYGTTPEEFVQHCLNGMTYTIGDVTVDGDTAKAEVTVTTKDIYQAMEDVQQEWTSGDKQSEVAQLYTSGGEDAVVSAIIQDFYSTVDNMTDTTDKNVEITLTKSDGQWSVDQSSAYDLGYSLFSNLE